MKLLLPFPEERVNQKGGIFLPLFFFFLRLDKRTSGLIMSENQSKLDPSQCWISQKHDAVADESVFLCVNLPATCAQRFDFLV